MKKNNDLLKIFNHQAIDLVRARFFVLLIFVIFSACGERDIVVSYRQQAKRNLDLKTNNAAVFYQVTDNSHTDEVMDLLACDIEKRLIEGGRFRLVDLASEDLRGRLIKKSLEESVTAFDDELLRMGRELNVSLLIEPSVHVDLRFRNSKRQRTIYLGTGILGEIFEAHRQDNKKVRAVKTRQVVVEDEYETRVMSLSGRVKVVNVETGQVISIVTSKSDLHRSKILVKNGAKDLSTHLFDMLSDATGLKEDVPIEHPPIASLIDSFIYQLSTKTVHEISPVVTQLDTLIYESGDLDVGCRLARIGKWDKAVEKWERVLAHEPDFFECLHNLGVAYIQLGDLEKSSLYLTEAISLDDDEVTLKVLDFVEQSLKQQKQMSDPTQQESGTSQELGDLESTIEEDNFFND